MGVRPHCRNEAPCGAGGRACGAANRVLSQRDCGPSPETIAPQLALPLPRFYAGFMCPSPLDPSVLVPRHRVPWGRYLFLAVCLLALILASYLSILKLTGKISDLAGCGGDEGCGSLLGGRWANWMLVPISVWAMLVYLPLLVLGIQGLNTPRRRRLAFMATGVLATAAFWFLAVQALIERQFCPYCGVLHACGLVAFGYVLSQVFTAEPAETLATIKVGSITAFLATALLIGGQIWGPQPASHEITEEGELGGQLVAGLGESERGAGGTPKPAETVDPGPSSSGAATNRSGRVLSYFGGELQFHVDEFPVIGDRDAPHIVVKYFDYTCPACRRMHDDLAQVQAHYPGQLAVLVIPCPLEKACNPSAPEAEGGLKELHQDACELARVALAVWRRNPGKFAEFHEELFARQGRVTGKSAHLMAKATAGEAFESALETDPWIRETIRKSVTVYGYLKDRNPRMPKLLLADRKILHGVVTDTATFEEVLVRLFELKAPAPTTQLPPAQPAGSSRAGVVR